MGERLLELFNKNLNEISLNNENPDIKTGTFLEENSELKDDIRFKYLKNLVLIHPNKLDVSESTDLVKKLIIMLSYNDTSLLKDIQLIDHEIIGVLTENCDTPILFVNIKNPESNDITYPFEARNRSCNFRVSSLNINEQVCLSIYMINIYKNEKDFYTRKIQVLAYLDRLMFKENEKHNLLTRLYEYYYSLVTDTYEGIEKVLSGLKQTSLEECMNFPLVLRRDLEYQLATVYKKCGFNEKALKIFTSLKSILEEIECLIALKRIEEAVSILKTELTKFDKIDTFDKRVLYCEYCIKLGWLLDDPKWFDKGYDTYKSYEPIEHKGRYYFKKEDFINSKIAYEKALEIVPQNERILFAYASIKIKLEEYLGCKDIFKRLIEMDKRNPEYARNLAICYYHEEKLEKCMRILKNNALGDSSSMEFYFKLVIKNKQKEEILWCISRISDMRYIELFLKLLVAENIISKEEAIESKNKNPHIKDLKIKWD
ncbi:hypothetical protein P3W45_000009 [Vairimorpha bombi]